MNTEQAADLAGKYLDEIKSLVNWAIGVALIALVLGLQGKSPLKVLDLELTRGEAAAVLSMLYATICAGVQIFYVRLSQLIATSPTEYLVPIFYRLSCHESLVNPFSSYPLPTARGHHKHWGLVLLVSIFWLGITSIYTLILNNRIPLVDFLKSKPTLVWRQYDSIADYAWDFCAMLLYALPLGLMGLLGVLIISEILSIPRIAGERLTNSETGARMENIANNLKSAAELGIAMGGCLFITVLLVGAIAYG